MADRIALAIEPDNDTANQIKPVARTEGVQGREHLEWRRRHGVGPHQQAGGHHPERRAAQGRLRDLQQAASQPEPARGSAGPDLVRGDAGDVRAAQEAEVARRRVPAQAARGERFRVQGGGAGRDWGAATKTFTSWTPIRTSCCRRMTRTSSSMARDDEERTLLVGDGVPSDTSEQRVPDTGQTPFEGEKFDPETQAAFAALEAGSGEGSPQSNDMVDLRNLWSDDDLPPNLGWEQGPDKARRRRNPAKKIRTVTARARRWAPRWSSRCVRGAGAGPGAGRGGSARAGRDRVRRLSRPTRRAWRCWRKVSWTSGA